MNDPVNSPAHYLRFGGVEPIEIEERLTYCRGTAVKYIIRAGYKDKSKEIEDLKKARWMIDREITRLEKEASCG